jgi:hypothetical protein
MDHLRLRHITLWAALAAAILSGCAGERVRTDLSRSTSTPFSTTAELHTMAIVPVSVQRHDATLVERLSNAFAAAWSREVGGGYLPVIPATGQTFDAVRATSDEFQRTGRISEETIEGFADTADSDYVLLLWVKNYGFSWDEMEQIKEIRLAFVLASTLTGRPRITGQGETVANGRRESFETLERELVEDTVAEVISLLPQPESAGS